MGVRFYFTTDEQFNIMLKKFFAKGGLGHLEEVRVEGLHCDLVQAGVVHADHVLVEPA